MERGATLNTKYERKQNRNGAEGLYKRRPKVFIYLHLNNVVTNEGRV